MPNIVSWLNKSEYQNLEKQCDLLNETIYEYTQKAIKERMKKHESLPEKANRWLYSEH